MNAEGAPLNVLIHDDEAAFYQKALMKQFPDLVFHTAIPGENNEALFRLCEILITFSTKLPDNVLESTERLRWVQALSAGTDKLESLLHSRPDILLTSASGIHGPFLSEMVLFQMLSLTRHAKTLYRQQKSADWRRFPGSILHGKHALVVGTGTSGEQIRRVCTALGMTVSAASRTPRALPYAEHCIAINDLHAHMGDIDFLILALALTPETTNCIDHRVLSSMKQGAYVVNVARGGVLDEAALLAQLENGRLGGAALDVFHTEPLPSTNPLWAHPKVLVTPHIAGLVEEYAEQALPVIAKNLQAYLTGNPQHMVNLVSRKYPTLP